MKNHSLFLLLFLFITSGYVSGLTQEEEWRRIDGENGTFEKITNQKASHIYVDSDGILWCVLNNYLSRYDGYSFQELSSYYFRFFYNEVYCLVEDKKRSQILLGTDKGILCFEKGSGSIRNSQIFERLNSDTVTAIAVDASGRIWLGTFSGKIFFTDNDSILMEFKLPATSYNLLRRVDILYCDVNNDIWVGRSRDISLIHNTDLTIKCITKSINSPSAITGASNGDIYVGNSLNNQIAVIDNNSQEISRLDYERPRNTPIRSLFFSKKNILHVVTSIEICFVDVKRKETVRYALNNDESFSGFIENAVGDSSSNNIWLITMDALYRQNNKRIIKTKKIHNISGIRSSGNPESFWVEKAESNLITQLNAETLEELKNRRNTQFGNTLLIENDSSLWYADGESVHRYSTTSQKTYHNIYARSFYYDSSTFLIGGKGAIYIYEKLSDKFVKHQLMNDREYDVAHILHLTPDKYLMLLDSSWQLVTLNTTDTSIAIFGQVAGGGMIIETIIKEQNQDIWSVQRRANSDKRYLTKIDLTDTTSTNVFFDLGDQSFFSIYPEVIDGFIFFASLQSGITAFNTKSAKVKSFGFQNIYYGTPVMTKNGMLIFTNQNGLVYFDPKQCVESKKSTAFFSKVTTSRDSFYMNWHQDSNNHIEIPFVDNERYSISFFLNEFTDPRQNTFYYQLEGFDVRMNGPQSSNTVSYTGLEPGKYALRVRGYDSYGYETNEAVLSIEILEPWWRTGRVDIWWPLIPVFVTLIFFLNFLKKKKIRYEQLIRETIQNTIHDSFSSRLEFVKLKLNRVADEKHDLELIELSKILNSISDVVQNVILPLVTKEIYSWNQLISELFTLVRNEFGSKVEIKQKGEVPKWFFPHDRLAMINFTLLIWEIITNISKHSRAGSVQIVVDWEADTNSKLVKFTIEDNGVGYDQKDKKEGKGIKNIKRRLDELSAHYELTTSDENGCRWAFSFKKE